MQGAGQAAAPVGEPVLAVVGVAKRYGRRPALRGVDVTVGAGEVVGLLGANGAGKSTLVKVACGLVRPDVGRATVCGVDAATRAGRRRLGYLPEGFRFPPALTPRELLAVHQRLAGSRGGDAERRRLLELVGATDVADVRLGALSQGNRQRVGLAQALVGDPRLLLLDEPTSTLDPLGRRAVLAVLGRLRADGVAVLVNSHLLTDVEAICDRVLFLRDGTAVGCADVAQLRRAGRGVEDAYVAAMTA